MSILIPNIILQRFGNIPDDKVRTIRNTIEECYYRLAPHHVELLDLLLFERLAQMNSFYMYERQRLGVTSEALSEQFFAIHDAWQGTPRIGVCLERLKQIPQLVQMGALRHEVGHSILHGSVEHYVFPIPPPLLEASKSFRLSRGYLYSILYLVSIAVKDFEVTRLLVEKGYVEDQLAYSIHVLAASQDDLKAWSMAQGKPAAVTLCAASRLKDAACTIAIRQVLQGSPVETLKKELSYLQDPILDRFLQVTEVWPQHMTADTLGNVNATVKLFVKAFLEPVFAESK